MQWSFFGFRIKKPALKGAQKHPLKTGNSAQYPSAQGAHRYGRIHVHFPSKKPSFSVEKRWRQKNLSDGRQFIPRELCLQQTR